MPNRGPGFEVAGRIVLTILGHARKKGLTPETLVEGLNFSLKTLRGPRARVAWGDFIAFWHRAEKALGGDQGMEEMCMEVVEHSLALHVLGRIFLTPSQLYLQMATRMSHASYSCLHVRSWELGDGRLVYEGHMEDGYTLPLSFGPATRGLMRAFPRMLGLPESEVEGVYDTVSFRFIVKPPPARTLAALWDQQIKPLPPPQVEDEDFDAAALDELAHILESKPWSGRAVHDAAARLLEAPSLEAVVQGALEILERHFHCRWAQLWVATAMGELECVGTLAKVSCEARYSRNLETGLRVVGRLDTDAHLLGPQSLVRNDLEALLPWITMALARRIGANADSEKAVAVLARRTGLTPRESVILRWLREGKTNAEIGIICGISARTVQKHVEHILEKIGVETRQAAALRTFSLE